MPELFIDRQVGALREYFLNEVIKKVEAGEETLDQALAVYQSGHTFGKLGIAAYTPQ